MNRSDKLREMSAQQKLIEERKREIESKLAGENGQSTRESFNQSYHNFNYPQQQQQQSQGIFKNYSGKKR